MNVLLTMRYLLNFAISRLPRAGGAHLYRAKDITNDLPWGHYYLYRWLALASWNPNRRYDKRRYIHYELEWKLTVNSRQVAKQTEQDLVLAPSDFWNETLISQLDALVRKAQVNKPSAADATTIVMSVTERSERNITKRFDEINVDWPVVERQLQTWSHLLRNGKKLILKVTFNYVEAKSAGPAGQGSTSGQLAERQVRRDAERAVLGRTAAWEHVFAVFSCPGAPCDRGPYCWQDMLRSGPP